MRSTRHLEKASWQTNLQYMGTFQHQIRDLITLHKGAEDKDKVMADVKENISFRNANLWILACAILIASVGLNMNSTAVIIGAMLISPLMGPITGAGFALGTYDFKLLKRAGKNLLIATIVSLLVSTIYFLISPFKETQSELLARTSPNIYDVLIAFFGGLTGAISLTRIDKGNPIPGVAIATALMPPLCTAGYAIAIGNLTYFLGAFYLYVINCFFICIATFFIIKYLKYPPVRTVDPVHDRHIRNGLTTLVIVMTVPSFYLAYTLYQQKKYTQKVEQFMNIEFTDKGYTIIYKRTRFNTTPRKIELAFLSKKFSEEERDAFNKKLLDYGITNTEIIIRQDDVGQNERMLNELQTQSDALLLKDQQIKELQERLTTNPSGDSTLLREIGILFPELQEFSIGLQRVYRTADSTQVVVPVLLYKSANSADTDKLRRWLQQKMARNDIELIRQN